MKDSTTTELKDSTSEDEQIRQRLNRLAVLMDSSIRIPIIGKRIGWDGILGLIPVVGDLAGGLVSAYILIGAVRLGAPAGVVVRMLANVGLETVIGAIPLLGDLFDMAFRANLKNVALLEAHLKKNPHTKSPGI